MPTASDNRRRDLYRRLGASVLSTNETKQVRELLLTRRLLVDSFSKAGEAHEPAQPDFSAAARPPTQRSATEDVRLFRRTLAVLEFGHGALPPTSPACSA